MIVDVHAHAVPATLLESLRSARGRFPSVELLERDGGLALAFAGNAPTRVIAPRLRDTDERMRWMRGNGIDRQVLSGWLDVFGYELPPAEGAAWSRMLNEHLRRMAGESAAFAALASVPLQAGELAAEVLAEALDAGFPGVMIGTQPYGRSGTLDDPALDPFWALASRRGAIVYVHPMFPCGDDRLADYGMLNAVGRLTDTTVAVSRLLYSGHLLRYPGVRLIVSHGGAALPFILGRLRRNHALHREDLADPEAGFRRLYMDSVLFDPEALRFLLSRTEPDRLLLGSDYPFPIGDPAPRRVIEDAGLPPAAVSAILGDTAAALFALDA